jgi:perosamine synthetase
VIKEKPGFKSNYCYPGILLEDSIPADRNTVIKKLKELNVHCRPATPE